MEFAAKGRNERLRTQLTEAMRDKSAAESKSRNLMDKLSATEAKKEELGCLVAAEKEDADKACTEAWDARTEASLALQRAAEAEASHRSLRDYLDKRRRPLPAQGSNGRVRCSWTRTGSLVHVRPPLTRMVRRWASAFSDGCKRN